MNYSSKQTTKKRRGNLIPLLLILTLLLPCTAAAKTLPNKYIIGVRQSLMQDQAWVQVVDGLKRIHTGAEVINYKNQIDELLPMLRKKQPRYLCIVDRPENIDKNFVVAGNRMCRQINDNIYDDYLWGIITGYSAQDALRMVESSRQPFEIKTALSTTAEVKSGIWFDRLVCISDGTKKEWYEKKGKTDKVNTYTMDNQYQSLGIFMNKWKETDPDLILTSSHATQYNLEMPFSSGNLRPRHGKLYADMFTPQYVPTTQKPRVYMPIGNCLIGDMDGTPNSMAAAWVSSGGATAMLGYVVSTWYGRNGWGALKFWLSTSGKHTLAEAAYLNRQDMYTYLERKNPKFNEVIPGFLALDENTVREELFAMTNDNASPKLDNDDVGFLYDKDVVVYYGDPAWNVKTQQVKEQADYLFSCKKEGETHVITLKTGPGFSMDKVKGKGFKEEHVKDIPVGYFLPERIVDPKVADNPNNLDLAVGENFILIYNQNLEPNQTYTITIK